MTTAYPTAYIDAQGRIIPAPEIAAKRNSASSSYLQGMIPPGAVALTGTAGAYSQLPGWGAASSNAAQSTALKSANGEAVAAPPALPTTTANSSTSPTNQAMQRIAQGTAAIPQLMPQLAPEATAGSAPITPPPAASQAQVPMLNTPALTPDAQPQQSPYMGAIAQLIQAQQANGGAKKNPIAGGSGVVPWNPWTKPAQSA